MNIQIPKLLWFDIMDSRVIIIIHILIISGGGFILYEDCQQISSKVSKLIWLKLPFQEKKSFHVSWKFIFSKSTVSVTYILPSWMLLGTKFPQLKTMTLKTACSFPFNLIYYYLIYLIWKFCMYLTLERANILEIIALSWKQNVEKTGCSRQVR